MTNAIVDVTEQKRLNEAREANPLEEVGTVPQRAAVGHGPRGLQRRRQRVGLLLARPVALAGLPLGRRRARRHLRRQAAAVLRARAVERARPDPEGAPVRPHQQRRQPRRRREGVLLLHRQHADALLHEVPLQVPAAGVPVPRPRRDQRAAGRARSSSTSCSTPARSTTTATSTCSWSTRRPAPRTCSSRSPSTTAGRKPRGCACCRRCGSGTPGRGARTIAQAVAARRRTGRRSRRRTTSSATYCLHCDGAPELLFTENETNAERLWGQPNASPLREGRIPRRTSSRGRLTR